MIFWQMVAGAFVGTVLGTLAAQYSIYYLESRNKKRAAGEPGRPGKGFFHQ